MGENVPDFEKEPLEEIQNAFFCIRLLTYLHRLHMYSSCMSACMICLLILAVATDPTRFLSFPCYRTAFCPRFEVNRAIHPIFLSPQFGWTHVTLLIVVTQSHLIIHNLFEGMIW